MRSPCNHRAASTIQSSVMREVIKREERGREKRREKREEERREKREKREEERDGEGCVYKKKHPTKPSTIVTRDTGSTVFFESHQFIYK